jgi:hypothetical protein
LNDKNKEMMLKIIEAKKQKSASQTSVKRSPGVVGNVRQGTKQEKQGGLFDK